MYDHRSLNSQRYLRQPDRPGRLSSSNLEPPTSRLRLFTPFSFLLFSYTYELPNLQLLCFDNVATVPGGSGGSPLLRGESITLTEHPTRMRVLSERSEPKDLSGAPARVTLPSFFSANSAVSVLKTHDAPHSNRASPPKLHPKLRPFNFQASTFDLLQSSVYSYKFRIP